MSLPAIPSTLSHGNLTRYDWDESGFFEPEEIAPMIDAEIASLLSSGLHH